MKTPYFVINEKILLDNISAFRNALNEYWPNSIIAYSIKTNSLPWVLKCMNINNIYAEAVSGEEYELARICGYKEDNIVFNGPIKSEDEIKNAFESESIINIDSRIELQVIQKFSPKHKGNLGVRININSEIFNKEDVGYKEDGFRFGFSEENGELGKVFSTLHNVYGDQTFGLHLHCNSITRSLHVYQEISRYTSKIIRKYDLKPSFIDIGGGFFGGIEGKATAKDYISIITKELQKVVDTSKTKLIIEPGSALIGSAVELHTSVVDVKKTGQANIITTDGSRIHIDPLWKKSNYMYKIESNNLKNTVFKQIICGYTCMDHDRMMCVENQSLLNIGDKIIYQRVGAYTMTFGGPFIRYFPNVYVLRNGLYNLVRKRMDVLDYYNIENYEEKLNNE